MVCYSDIQNNNTSLRHAGSGLVAAFLGATNGIGLAALESLTRHTDSPTIFVVGRSRPKLDRIVARLQDLNAEGTYHAVLTGDLTLTQEAQRAAVEIRRQTSKLDLLVMSPGWLNFRAEYTRENLESQQSLRYYTRTRFLLTLLPLLRASPSPRVVSVLLAGKESPTLFEDDWTLTKNWSVTNLAVQAASMTTLFFEELSQDPKNKKLVFIHLYPGAVSGTGLTLSDQIGWVGWVLIRYIAPWVIWAVGLKVEEVGERVVFAATSGRFRRLDTPVVVVEGQKETGVGVRTGTDGRVGSGVYTVGSDTEVCVARDKDGGEVLKKLRAKGLGRVVYEHTLRVLEGIERG